MLQQAVQEEENYMLWNLLAGFFFLFVLFFMKCGHFVYKEECILVYDRKGVSEDIQERSCILTIHTFKIVNSPVMCTRLFLFFFVFQNCTEYPNIYEEFHNSHIYKTNAS